MTSSGSEQKSAQQQQQVPLTQHEQQGEACSHCGAGRSGKWKRHPTTGARLCDPCRGYMSRHGGQMRPVGVQCLQCGGDSPGPQHNAAWRPHPVSGEGWLCSPCFFEVRRQTDVRRCLECGAGRSAPGKAAGWCRHPVTGEEWLCGTCYGRVRYRRQEGEEAEADGEAMPRPATKKQRQEQEQEQQQLQQQPQQQQQPQSQPQPQPQSQPQPQPQPQPKQDLLGVLLEAAGTPAGAAGGLTSELAASFCAVFDTLRPDQQAAKVRGVWALLCMLGARKSTAFASCCLALGLHAMRAGLQGVAASREAARWRAPPPLPAAGDAAAPFCAARTARPRGARDAQRAAAGGPCLRDALHGPRLTVICAEVGTKEKASHAHAQHSAAVQRACIVRLPCTT